jgi:diguanylate cyclase (GGDEF)-like protein
MAKKKLSAYPYTHETDKLMACLEVGKLLTSTLDRKEILELIMLKVSQLIDAQNWSLLLKDEATGELTFEIVVGINNDLVHGIRLAPGEGIACHVAATGLPLFIPSVKGDPRFNRKIDLLTGFTTQSIICLPLKIHGEILGVIEIINVQDMGIFQTNDLPILTILADYAAIAIENSRYFSRIQKMGITDEYTGLYNARVLHQMLDEWIQEDSRRERKFAVVFVDIDNFKEVVDGYGHLLGTQVLKEVGETISSCLTGKDVLVKYGGDEYIIILPDVNKQAAFQLTEKIAQATRRSIYLKEEPRPVKVTASFGIAMYPEDARTKKDLLILADNLLYGIKKASKNGIGMICR